MPPRLPQLPALGSLKLCLRPSSKSANPFPLLPITSTANASSKAEKRKHQDPYALAQAKQRKAANQARQQVLQEERAVARGDPVRGIPTPFLESFDQGSGVDLAPSASGEVVESTKPALNYFLKPELVEKSLQHSYILTQPVISKDRDAIDPQKEDDEIRKHAEDHERAKAAVERIVSLSNGNQKDRTRSNVQRCIEMFGRHNTDQFLEPKPAAITQQREPRPPKQRAGPDTGSSEVQIAILTAKIRALADALEAKGGNKDKMNKRNLRLLVHRRQKLLNYMLRKERGSERWQRVTKALGLTEATYKGEISL